MTDTPGPPPATPPHSFGAPQPPTLPPGAPAGYPSLWQAAVLFLASAALAGGACGWFVLRPGASSASDTWSLVFVLCVLVAGGALALLVFRLWRRRTREAWPGLAQCLLLATAGAVLAIGGCGGFMLTVEATWAGVPGMVLAAVFVAGLALAVGAGELFLIAVARLMMAPRK